MVKSETKNKTTGAMDDLRHTAYAYHNAAKGEKGNSNEASVLEFFKQMDENGDGKVSFEEFKRYMKSVDMVKYGSDRDFFEKLTRGGRDYLEFPDVVVLLFVINGGRPFCDKCLYFVHGTFFTCVRCFEKENDYYYNLCTSCYARKNHGHCHKEFVDPVTLLRLKAKRESVKQGTARIDAITTTTSDQPSNSEPTVSSVSSKKNKIMPSKSDAIVVHIPHPQKPGVALELMQFAVACTTVAAAVSSFCTIM